MAWAETLQLKESVEGPLGNKIDYFQSMSPLKERFLSSALFRILIPVGLWLAAKRSDEMKEFEIECAALGLKPSEVLSRSANQMVQLSQDYRAGKLEIKP